MKILVLFGVIIVTGLFISLSSILNGYALSVLWGWFMVPTFGVTKLSIPAAIGIALVVSCLTHQTHNFKKEEEEGERGVITKIIIVAILKPSVVICFGWIVHMFM